MANQAGNSARGGGGDSAVVPGQAKHQLRTSIAYLVALHHLLSARCHPELARHVHHWIVAASWQALVAWAVVLIDHQPDR
jgi:hypothetical protein